MKNLAQTTTKILLPTLLLGAFVPQTFAATINQVAYNLEIKDENPKEGSVVSYKNGIYELSEIDYDSGIYGVIQSDAAVTLNEVSITTRPVVTAGQATVRVSKVNGEIKEGDLITSSKDKGIAQKATKSGHVLGKALGSFPSEGNSGEEGLIPVLISINYNLIAAKSEELTDTGVDQVAKKVSSALVSGSLPDLLKYIFALLLGLITFFWGLAHFVRSNRTAVEAIARNPLAKNEIRREQILGSIVILIISALGLGVAVAILVFL
jgi:hypothetical protein